MEKIEKVVFTNGCFDIIHPGHVDLLERAKGLGTKLIVGINSDSSVRAIKGSPRPFFGEDARRLVLLGLGSVDEVLVFDENTPENMIREVKPDVLVKGGDWAENEIIGADFVKQYGGLVVSLPLKQGYSSSVVVEKIRSNANEEIAIDVKPELTIDSIAGKSLSAHIDLFRDLLTNHIPIIEKCADLIKQTLDNGNKILICGNGGSAADAQHIAAEFVGRFEKERKGLPAIALTTDTSALTALANDYGFERVFTRQVEALAAAGDLLIGISTSGNSPNVNGAIMAARSKGCRTVGLTGGDGKKLASLCDLCVLVPEKRTSRIQEAHITIGHIWCEIIDCRMAEGSQ